MAGLGSIPRQMASFTEFRGAMLAGIHSKHPFSSWRAREEEDPGLMLLEMWAYICDSISFYDEVIANETYLRTAKQQVSINKIASLLGYFPRPAVSSFVTLAAIADGRQQLKIPKGTAFRSGAFDGHPPQVFEASRDQFIHPFSNSFNIAAPIPQNVPISDPQTLMINSRTSIEPGMILFLSDSGDETQNQVLRVKESIPCSIQNSAGYCKISFESGPILSDPTPLTGLKLSYPVQKARILEIKSDETSPKVNDNTLVLDKLYPDLVGGEAVLVSRGKEFRWFTISSLGTTDAKVSKDTSITIANITYQIAGNTFQVTKLILSQDINLTIEGGTEQTTWETSNCGELQLHFNMLSAGSIVNEPKNNLLSADPLFLKSPVERPPENLEPARFLLLDKNKQGLSLKARVDYEEKILALNQNEGWKGPLELPVEVYGNLVEASRGESVRQEVLGSGDASTINQSFKLKKKPLTYLFSPTAENDQAVKSVLEIRVNGILWKEAANFYNSSPSDRIYTLRQDEEGETYVTFGDGISGQRLPSGKDNVIAEYRFGAGHASPPAQSITQVSIPLKGLKNILNPVGASGGADPETIPEMRNAVPKSVMLLGRIISMLDVEAVVSSVPGVRATQVEWRWSKTRQGSMIHVYYIGELSLQSTIIGRLNAISDPSQVYQVEKAVDMPVKVIIDLSIDPAYNFDDLVTATSDCLINATNGLLSTGHIGIGKPIYRSQLYKVLTSIEGITGVGKITWGDEAFDAFAKCPPAGSYYDVETGGLYLNRINATT